MTNTVTAAMLDLIDYAQAKGLMETEDREYTLNRLMELYRMDAPEESTGRVPAEVCPETATPILENLLDHAVSMELCADSTEQRDLFAAKIMGILTPHPAAARERFSRLYTQEGPSAATGWFYKMCRDTDYIKVDRIAKNVRYLHDTPVGELEITINLSKPEKDPRDIAAQRNAKQTGYPRCMLCVENPGYAGRAGFPARQNHRVIPLTLGGEAWYLQYSPYAYYDEHAIVFNREHVPMRISRESFVRLFDFVEQFPGYMLGSNADLPIVGGSILSHDHFQGGGYVFPMEHARVRLPLTAPVDGVEANVSDWPMSCIVLKGKDREKVIALADRILTAWRAWSDPDCDIFAETDGTPHNTITPIARMEDGCYKLSLVLRNNRTTQAHPLGLFHPHAELHHIKKENIGLIEVMGLFILPGRLVKELDGLRAYLTGARKIEDAPAEEDPLAKHYDWIRDIAARRGCAFTAAEADDVLRDELAQVCARVLCDAGVYKRTPEGDAGILRFLNSVGFTAK